MTKRSSSCTYVNWWLVKCPTNDLRNSYKEKSPKYYMSTSLTITTPHSCTVKAGELYEVIFLPWPTRLGRFFSATDEAGIICSWPTRPNTWLHYGIRTTRLETLLLEADEALALRHFHSFVLMHIHGDNSYLLGDDNYDHRHSLIGGVPWLNAVNVINWRPLEGPGTRSHTILWPLYEAWRKFILKWEIVLCNSQENE